MGDTIRAIGEMVDKFGMGGAFAISALAGFAMLMAIHLLMLKRWAESNDRMARIAEERASATEKRQDTLLVANLNAQKVNLDLQTEIIRVNNSQDKKLDEIVSLHREQRTLAIANMEATKSLIEKLGADPNSICQLDKLLRDKFPGLTDEMVLSVIRYFHSKQQERNQS